MNPQDWDEENVPQSMYGVAFDDGRVYQSTGDQYIEVQENHYHFGADREPEYVEDVVYGSASGHDGPLHGVITCCLFILPPAPVMVVGSSLKVMFSTTPGPAITWAVLYTVVSFVVSLISGFFLLEGALNRIPYPLGGESLLLSFYALLGLALFVVFFARDPDGSGYIGDLGRWAVQTFGPV